MQVSESYQGKVIECPECGSYIETSSGGALSGSDASVPPRSDEETEEYEESESVDRRIIVGISAWVVSNVKKWIVPNGTKEFVSNVTKGIVSVVIVILFILLLYWLRETFFGWLGPWEGP